LLLLYVLIFLLRAATLIAWEINVFLICSEVGLNVTCCRYDELQIEKLRMGARKSEDHKIRIWEEVLIMALAVTSSDVRASNGGCCERRSMYLRKLLTVSAIILLFSMLLPSAHSQTKNEVGLVIGKTITPSQTLSQNAIFIGPAGNAVLTSSIKFDSSLALGAEYDRRLTTNKGAAIYGGLDFLASPLDVKLSQLLQGVIPQYAYVFLTPHLKVKFNPDGTFAPWLSFGGGFARFLGKAPAATLATGAAFRPGTNTGTLEFGAGLDTRTVVRLLRIPIGFRFEARDFYSGLPNYNQKINSNLQNNVAFTGGLLVRF